jgi:hypothetical protein
MPASRSTSRNTELKPRPRPRRRWPLVLIGLLVLLGAAVFVLPASMIARFLPPQVQAEDFSGSLIHGAAGKISVNAHDAGAIEWRLHPLALLRAELAVDIHWVKVSFVIDGTAELAGKGFAAHDIHGGGPLENLRDIGLGADWRGACTLSFAEIKSDFSKLQSAVGSLEVANLASAAIAGGADLGGYTVRLATGAVSPDGSINASLNDTGGPVEVQAQIQFSPAARTGTLSGTLKARADASPELRHQLDSLAQVRPRDAQGRFPVDLEFTL